LFINITSYIIRITKWALDFPILRTRVTIIVPYVWLMVETLPSLEGSISLTKRNVNATVAIACLKNPSYINQ